MHVVTNFDPNQPTPPTQRAPVAYVIYDFSTRPIRPQVHLPCGRFICRPALGLPCR